MRVRTKLSWRNFKRSPRVKWVKDNPGALIQGTLLLIIFILFAIWSNEKFGEMYTRVSEFIASLPASLPIALEQETILWILAILIILGIVIAAYRRGYAIPSTGSAGILVGFLGAVALVVLAVYLVCNFLWTDSDAPTLIATHEWSRVIRIPVGKQVLWERRENAAYAVRTQTGEIFRFPRDPEGDTRRLCEKHHWVPGGVSSLQFTVIDREINEVGFDLDFSPYEEGGPCRDEAPLPTPEYSIPEVVPVASNK